MSESVEITYGHNEFFDTTVIKTEKSCFSEVGPRDPMYFWKIVQPYVVIKVTLTKDLRARVYTEKIFLLDFCLDLSVLDDSYMC